MVRGELRGECRSLHFGLVLVEEMAQRPRGSSARYSESLAQVRRKSEKRFPELLHAPPCGLAPVSL
eukprot:11220398-Lingulodinium_polyedra.AAC.2